MPYRTQPGIRPYTNNHRPCTSNNFQIDIYNISHCCEKQGEKLNTAILVCLHLSSPFTFPMFVQSKEFIKRVKKWLIKEPIPPIDVKVVLLIHTRTEKGTCHLLLPLSDPAPISFHGCPNEHAPVITSAIPYRTICNIGVSVAFQHALGISERGSKGEKHAASQEEFLPVVPVVPGPEVCVPGLRCFLRS